MSDHRPVWRLSLLGAWQLSCDGREAEVGRNGQRLFAFLALHGACARSYVAGALWPDCSDTRASGNLRATLSRLHRRGLAEIVPPSCGVVSMSPAVQVDVHRVRTAAARVLDGPPVRSALRSLAGDELLAGWYDDWVLVAREQLRQQRLHALEALSARFLTAGDTAAAVEAALATVALEPLRESAHGAVIRAHLVEGNRAEALQHFGRLRTLLRGELGVEPSRTVSELFRTCHSTVTPRG
ncbi:BTAD domain-containing putative transcriptional regulator [Actinoplanes sp. NPDC026619]|uniref:AfsR/SARP family transcriptional regulator n=1 Tax=Actinoplanes sp. NPDC026619 TaxID=3155798 RepID=UPI0034060973